VTDEGERRASPGNDRSRGEAQVRFALGLALGAAAGLAAEIAVETWWRRRERRRDLANAYVPRGESSERAEDDGAP
jgi:hypothetical protein